MSLLALQGGGDKRQSGGGMERGMPCGQHRPPRSCLEARAGLGRQARRVCVCARRRANLALSTCHHRSPAPRPQPWAHPPIPADPFISSCAGSRPSCAPTAQHSNTRRRLPPPPLTRTLRTHHCAGPPLPSCRSFFLCCWPRQVADFGLSRTMDVRSKIKTRTYGTITHMPPETLISGIISKVIGGGARD